MKVKAEGRLVKAQTKIAGARAKQVSAPVESTPVAPKCSYADALQQGLSQAMELDDRVFVLGQLVDYKPGVFGTTTGLVEKFGADRVQDFPVSESVMTSAAIGAALLLITRTVDPRKTYDEATGDSSCSSWVFSSSWVERSARG